MIYDQSNRALTLHIGALIDRGNNRSFFKIRNHFLEDIRGDEFNFPGKPERTEGAADRQAVGGVHIKSGKAFQFAKQLETFQEGFVLVLVALQHLNDLSACTNLRKHLGEPLNFFSMVLGAQHSRNNGHLRVRGNEPAHQFSRHSPVKFGFHTHHRRTATRRRVRGNTNYSNAFLLSLIDQRAELLGIRRSNNQSFYFAGQKFFHLFGFA